MDEETQARLASLRRTRKSIQQQQRRVILPPHAGGFKKIPSRTKQFDWEIRLQAIKAEINLLLQRCN